MPNHDHDQLKHGTLDQILLDSRDRTIEQLAQMAYVYDRAMKVIDEVFQGKDCILPGFCLLSDDKIDAIKELALKYKELTNE